MVLPVALACTGPAVHVAPDPIALDGWRRAEDHGLILYTDVPEITAARVFRQLHRFIDIVSLEVNGRPFRSNRPLNVFVFGRRSEYRHFAPEGFAGHALRGDDENMTALSIEQVFEGTSTLYHELVHVVLHNDPDRRFPSWYHEGLAGFFETSVLRGDVLTIGALSPDTLQVIRSTQPLALRRLLSSPLGGHRDRQLFYADAWAFVHFGLLSAASGGPDRREAFATFVSRVSTGNPWLPAFLAAFEATPEEIAGEYESHREQLAQTNVTTLANLQIDLGESVARFEPLDPLEIGRKLAQLGISGFESGWESSAQLFDRILEATPDDPEAIYGRIRVAAHLGELDLGDTLWKRLGESQRLGAEAWQAEADLYLAHASDLDPDESPRPRAKYLAQAVSGYVRVLDEAPDRLSALIGLGQALVLAEDEDPTLGISALERATAMSPNSPELRLDLAELLIRSSATKAANSHLDYVVETYPGSPFAKRAKELRRMAR